MPSIIAQNADVRLTARPQSTGQRARKCSATLNKNQSQPMVATINATENEVSLQRRCIRNDIAMPQDRNAVRGLT
jgi:hypothetical protein